MKTHFHLSCCFQSEQVSVNITCNIWDFDESFSQHESLKTLLFEFFQANLVTWEAVDELRVNDPEQKAHFI